jgi:hypothetical protein
MGNRDADIGLGQGYLYQYDIRGISKQPWNVIFFLE